MKGYSALLQDLIYSFYNGKMVDIEDIAETEMLAKIMCSGSGTNANLVFTSSPAVQIQ